MLRSRQSDPGTEGERPPLDMLDTVDSRQCKFNECLVFRSSVFVHQARHASQRSHSHANILPAVVGDCQTGQVMVAVLVLRYLGKLFSGAKLEFNSSQV